MNRALLARLVALLAAMIGDRMPRASYRKALSRLRPLESALRRLIVIAAQNVTVAARKPGSAPSLPEGAAERGGARIAAFPLFDPRRRFGVPHRVIRGPGPQIRFLDEPFLPSNSETCLGPKLLDTSALLRRVARLERALGRVTQEAKRLVRWHQRHAGRIKRPMRPGRPPGFCCRRSKDPVQQILEDLQILALRALQPEDARLSA